MTHKTHKLALAIAASVTFSPQILAEEQAIERILVTSDFRAQDIEQSPKSLSVLSQQSIEQRQAQYLDEVLNMAPNINFTRGASRGRYIQIRGIGERSQYAEPINPSVGFLVDDMDFSGVASVGTLFDVKQVEVLRGPQGTEFGAGAMAGVIKVITNDPSDSPQGQVNLSLAEQNTWSLGAAYGNAINDKLQYRVAAQQYKSDGFGKNIYLDKPTNDLDELTSRFKLRYLASEDLTLDLSYQYFDIDNGYDAFALDNDGLTRSDEPGFDRQKTHALNLKADWQLPQAQVLAIASHTTSDIEYGYDEDWTYVGFHPWEYSSFDAYFRDRDTSSLDVRVLSNDASRLFNNSTSWVAGVYLKNTDEQSSREYTYADSDFFSEYQPETVAVYGQLKSQLSDSLRLTFGMRSETASIDYQDNSGFANKQEDTMLGGKLVLDAQLDSGTMAYASIQRGYKLGGVNPDLRVPEESRVYAPEYNWNYEVGLKRRVADGKVQLRFAAFYMDRQDTQVADYDVQLRDDGTPTFVDIIKNADQGKSTGIELESRWLLTETLTLSANLGLLDAKFEDYTNAKGELVEERDLAQAPDYSFNLGADWRFADNWQLHLEADGKDSFYFSDGHDEKSAQHVLLHAHASYQLGDWRFAIWAKNLTDKRYYVRGFGGFSNDPRDYYETPEPYYQLGDGRQLGVTVDYQF